MAEFDNNLPLYGNYANNRMSRRSRNLTGIDRDQPANLRQDRQWPVKINL
jgi:hypothetical protein